MPKYHDIPVKIEEVQEALRIYLESIALLPVEPKIDTSEPNQRMETVTTGFLKGKLYIPLPPAVKIFGKREENEEVYDILGALHAAAHRHGQIIHDDGMIEIKNEGKELEDVAKQLWKESVERYGTKDTPMLGEGDELPRFEVAGLRTSTFKKYFGTHEEFYDTLRKMAELGRVMHRFYGQNPGAPERHRKVLAKLYREEVEAAQKAGGKTAIDKIAGVKLSKQELLDTILMRLRYSLITGTRDFELTQDERKEKEEQEKRDQKSEEDTPEERLEKHKRLIINKDSPDYHTGKLMEIAKPLYSRDATRYTSCKTAGQMLFYFYDRYRSKTIPEMKRKRRTSQEINNIDQIAENIEATTHLSTAEEAQRLRLTALREHFETRVKETLTGTYPYHEWNSVDSGIPEEKGGRKKGPIKDYVHVVERRQVPKPKGQTYPYPEIDMTLNRKVQSQFEHLQPEGRTILRRQKRGRLDTRAFVRFANRVRAGIPTRADYYWRETTEERRVAVLLLVDISDSTGELITPEHTILDKLKEATHHLTIASGSIGDPLAIYAVTSFPDKQKGARFTYFYEVKEFDDTMASEKLREVLTQLEPTANNRDGAIIRHGATILQQRPEETKLLLYINDGAPEDKPLMEPQDKKEKFVEESWMRRGSQVVRNLSADKPKTEYDMPYKGTYAYEDLKHALREAGAKGITPVVIRVNQVDDAAIAALRLTGVQYRTVKPDMSDLTKILAKTYVQFTR